MLLTRRSEIHYFPGLLDIRLVPPTPTTASCVCCLLRISDSMIYTWIFYHYLLLGISGLGNGRVLLYKTHARKT